MSVESKHLHIKQPTTCAKHVSRNGSSSKGLARTWDRFQRKELGVRPKKESKWLHLTVNYQKRQGILLASEEILKEIVMINKCGKILARISAKMITRFLRLLTMEKANEICIWISDRHTVGKFPSSLMCSVEKKNEKAEFHVELFATQLFGVLRLNWKVLVFSI